jgi:hypothetical protein
VGYTISVLFGNGNGTFQAPVNYASDYSPRSIAIMDYNGDGILDLAVTAYGGSYLDTFLGNGDGTFQIGPRFKTGQQPTSVRSADFNKDGKPDLVITIGGHPITPITLQDYVTVLLNSPLSVSSSTVQFNMQNVGTTSATQTVSLTNMGTTAINITGVSVTGSNPTAFKQTNTCTTPLAAGGSCLLHVKFEPTTTGFQTASVTIDDSAVASPLVNVLMTGTGQ